MSKPSNRREELRRQQEQAAARKRTNRIVGIGAALLAVILAVVLIVVIVQSTAAPTASGTQITPPNASAKKDAIVVNPGKARASAPTVTLYLDYQCPNCKVFEHSFSDMLRKEAEAGTWTLQYKTMTFMDLNLKNTASNRAAMAAACSDVVGSYAQYAQAIYDHQAPEEVTGSEGYAPKALREELPASLGISGEKLTQFQQCFDANATADFVAAVNKAAYADGVTGTPSIAVNGKVLDLRRLTSNSPDALKQLILGG